MSMAPVLTIMRLVAADSREWARHRWREFEGNRNRAGSRSIHREKAEYPACRAARKTKQEKRSASRENREETWGDGSGRTVRGWMWCTAMRRASTSEAGNTM